MFANTVTMNDEQKTDSMVVKIDNFDEKIYVCRPIYNVQKCSQSRV